MGRQFAGVAETVVLRIIDGHGKYFVVLLAAVDHRHQADGSRLHQRQRRHGFLTKDQHVERIIVLGQRLWDKAVIRGVVDRRVKNAIQPQQAGFLVQLVLDAGTHRDFNDGSELAG